MPVPVEVNSKFKFFGERKQKEQKRKDVNRSKEEPIPTTKPKSKLQKGKQRLLGEWGKVYTTKPYKKIPDDGDLEAKSTETENDEGPNAVPCFIKKAMEVDGKSGGMMDAAKPPKRSSAETLTCPVKSKGDHRNGGRPQSATVKDVKPKAARTSMVFASLPDDGYERNAGDMEDGGNVENKGAKKDGDDVENKVDMKDGGDVKTEGNDKEVVTLGKWMLGPMCIDKKLFTSQDKQWETREEMTVGMELKAGPSDKLSPINSCFMVIPRRLGKKHRSAIAKTKTRGYEVEELKRRILEKEKTFGNWQKRILFCIAALLFLNASSRLLMQDAEPNSWDGTNKATTSLHDGGKGPSPAARIQDTSHACLFLFLLWSCGIMLRHILFRRSIEQLIESHLSDVLL